VLIACRRGPQAWRPLWLGVASLLMVLALLNKIQVVFLICTLPVLLLPFSPDEAPARGFWETSRAAWIAPVIAAIVAVVAFLASKDILVYGLTTSGSETLSLPALGVGNKAYWTAIAAWLAAGMIAYGMVWRVNLTEGVTAALCIAAGGMIALLALRLNYNPNNVLIVFHPLEQMVSFAAGEMRTGDSGLVGSMRLLLEGIPGLIARRTFILQSSPRPTIFLEWFVVAAAIFAWRRGERRVVLQVSTLMLSVWGVDLLGTTRGLKQEYFLLTDPLVIIAAALLVAQVPALLQHRWMYPVGAALIVAHVAISQAEPVKHMFSSNGPEVLCGLYHHARQAERLPICGTKPPSS
jgi:energy-converting hydrogenase Eha subunit A